MKYHYVWLIWSSAFLIPWFVLSVALPAHRAVMWKSSLFMAPFGLTEPLFVPEYWNPPSLFELARRTGFDIESIIFSFAIGGIIFLGIYTAFLLGLKWSAPGYIEQVWNLAALSGYLLYGLPLEELLFGFGFGLFWSGLYEHFAWQRSVRAG